MNRVLKISPDTVAPLPSNVERGPAKKASQRKPRTTIAELEARLASLNARIESGPVVTGQNRIAAWALGVIMPVFSVGFTAIAGLLASAGRPVWVVVAFAAAAGLIVSLRHVTLAITLATRTPKHEALLLAIGFEVGVVGIELANVTAPDVIQPMLGYGLMALLAAVVALLNVFAFMSKMAEEQPIEA